MAYADFVTAMMAFFLVMWITAQSVEVKQSVANYFNDPFAIPEGETGAAPMQSNQEVVDEENSGRPQKKSGKDGTGGKRGSKNKAADAAALKNANQAAVSRKKTHLLVLHDGSKNIRGTAVFFPEFSAELSDEAKNELKNMAKKSIGFRNKIEIRGHSTRRSLPPGSPYSDEWQLAYGRCMAVMKHLLSLKIEPDRIRLSQAGSYEPQTIRIAPDWEKQNSRVEVYLLDEIADDFLGTKEERNERFQN